MTDTVHIHCKSVDDLPAGAAVYIIDDAGDVAVECNRRCSTEEILSALGPALTVIVNQAASV